MSKNLFFLISFVVVLGLAGSAWAYPLDEAVGIWHMADDSDAVGPPFTNLDTSTRYIDFVDVTGTGIDGARARHDCDRNNSLRAARPQPVL